ncbi:hypothetical protein ABT039_22500 [Streptomyces lasiicapitis]|uniref:hypothetical protein n=1 Tax=Streptomyces lasiicapitis TaxID=1923961 RepID=UPI0033247701
MTDTTTVTELRWNKDVYPPVGTDDTSWIPCTDQDGRPAALAVDDDERVALGCQLLHLDRDDDTVNDQFFEPERLYQREAITFRCEGLALHPASTDEHAFGFRRDGRPDAMWEPAVLNERAWGEGWEDVTCPEHGYECAPHTPATDCPMRR